MNTDKLQVVIEIHTAARYNFRRRRKIITNFTDLWQADFLDLRPHAQENDGFRHNHLVINCYSKYSYTEAFEKKTGKEVTGILPYNITFTVFKNILNICTELTDNGMTLYDRQFGT